MDNMEFNNRDIEIQLRRIDQPKLVEDYDNSPLETIAAYLTNPSTKRAARLAATQALIRFPDQFSIPLLMLPLTDEDKAVRVAALELCATLSHRVPVTLVAASLTDPEWSVRATAAWALGRFGEKAPLADLIALLENKEEVSLVRGSVLHALGELGERVPIEVIVNALADEEWPVREVAAITLGTLGTRAPIEPIVKRLREDKDSSVLAAAALALASVGPLPEDALNALRMTLDNPEPSVQQIAYWTFERVAKQVIERMLAIKAKLSVDETSLFEQQAKLLPEAAFVSALFDRDKAVRLAATKILGKPDEEIFEPVSSLTLADEKSLNSQQTTLAQPQAIKRAGNVEFVPLVPPDLVETVPLIAQAFDNQWVPRTLLRLITDGKLTYTDIASYVDKLVRTEYIRSLINGRHVVMNRAYFYNNAVVSSDFLPGRPHREAFKTLLDSGVIIPFLLSEQTPDEKPKFSTDPTGLVAWQQICQEVRMSCVRFTWDNPTAQQAAFDKLARRFHSFAAGAETGNLSTYLTDFALDERMGEPLRERLLDLTDSCTQIRRQQKGKFATREELYKMFVTEDHSSPSERRYDGSKPFASEIKQFLDLAYNVNLADALNGYLLTPNDTLPRVALQEWQKIAQEPGSREFTTAEIIRIARQTLFSHIQAGLYFKSMRFLSLQDVLEIRKTDEWYAYVDALDVLLKGNILRFEQQAPQIYLRYAALMARITDMLGHRHKLTSQTNFKAPWDPVAELEIEVAGARLALRWTDEGLAATFSGREQPDTPPNGSAAFVTRLNIGEWSGSHTRADLFTSFDFMKGKLDAAQEQWAKLQADLKEILHGRERREDGLKIGPTLNEKAST